MQEEHPKSKRVSGGCLVLCVTLLFSVVLALFLVSARRVGSDSSRQAAKDQVTGNPLLGSWTKSSERAHGTTAVLTFDPDGRMTSIVSSDESGRLLHDESGTWSVMGDEIVIRKDRKGIAAVLDALPGVEPIGVARIPLVSVSPDELKIGKPDDFLTYHRDRMERRPIPK